MSSTLIFLGVLSTLVVFHEFGHFLIAKAVGIRVDKFSVGFGPVLFGKKFRGTEFCVSLLPLGGFVKLAGENPGESAGEPWEFSSKTVFQRFLVVFAGPFMNAFLAFLLFSFVFLVGSPSPATKIGKVLQGSPAQTAGILEGDKIISVNGKAVGLWEDILRQIQKSEGKIIFSLERAGFSVEAAVTPDQKKVSGLFGKVKTIAFVGIAPSTEVVHVKNSFFKAVAMGFERVWTLSVMIVYSLWLLITGALPFKDSVTGPIGIFFMTQAAAQMGLASLLYFAGSLSVSLFILNLLPMPVLDGGHLLFIFIEKLKGSPLKESVKERMTQGGLILLLLLMAVVIFQDVQRFSLLHGLKKIFIK